MRTINPSSLISRLVEHIKQSGPCQIKGEDFSAIRNYVSNCLGELLRAKIVVKQNGSGYLFVGGDTWQETLVNYRKNKRKGGDRSEQPQEPSLDIDEQLKKLKDQQNTLLRLKRVQGELRDLETEREKMVADIDRKIGDKKRGLQLLESLVKQGITWEQYEASQKSFPPGVTQVTVNKSGGVITNTEAREIASGCGS